MNPLVTRSMLLDSLVFGKLITLAVWDREGKEMKSVTGHVTGLQAEEGVHAGKSLNSFNVTVYDDEKGEEFVTYVRTID